MTPILISSFRGNNYDFLYYKIMGIKYPKSIPVFYPNVYLHRSYYMDSKVIFLLQKVCINRKMRDLFSVI